MEDVEVSFSKHGRLSYSGFQHGLDTVRTIKPAPRGLHLPAASCVGVSKLLLPFYRFRNDIKDQNLTQKKKKNSIETNKLRCENTRLTLPDASGPHQEVPGAAGY